MSTNPGTESTDRSPYRDVLRQKLLHRSVVSGKITIPAAPDMIDEYVELCANVFEDVGRPFSEDDLERLRSVLLGQLQVAFDASQRSQIVIAYEAKVGGVLNYHVKAEWFTIEGAYDNWVATRKPPLFGTHPDARVMALVKEVADPTGHPVLDIGAGTGRNALALARLGHPVDAVEMAPKFVEILKAEVEKEGLAVRTIQRDVFATPAAELRRDYGTILLSEVVSDFRTVEQLRSLFELAVECLAGGGKLIFNAFLGRMGYVPDEGVRQFGQQVYTGIFTNEELGEAVSGLPLQLLSDESVYRYEKAHLPHGAWPPTGWYENWVTGRDLFNVPREECPIELRWLVYQKPTW